MNKPAIIGVAGGSASGKTTVSHVIGKRVGFDLIAYLQHDSYYKDLRDYSPEERAKINFDHPDSLDTWLMIEHLHELLAGRCVAAPTYDFNTHRRSNQTITIFPKSVILVEGILIFAEPQLRDLFDMKIFVYAEADIRLARRLKRDIIERGRLVESVLEQWLNTVKPMHDQFVEPSMRWADIIIPHGRHNQVAMDMIVTRIQSLLNESKNEQ